MFLGAFLASLDISVIAAALPRIASDFGAQTQMSWIATAYLLAYTAFQPIYGKFSDIFGRKQMYLVGSVIFLIASVGCGAAPSMTALILFRALQGLGGSALFSVVIIMVSDMFPNVEERARYQSMVWLAFAVSSITGPLLGGAFVEHVSWRWCFYINLPLSIISIVLVGWLFKVPFEKSNLSEKLRRVDYAGLVLVVATVLCLLLPLTWGGVTYSWNSTLIIVLFCVFAMLAVVLIFVESRVKEAIIPPAVFLNRNVSMSLVILFVFGATFMGCTFYLPLYFQVVKGTSTTDSGLRMIPNSIAMVISTMGSSFLLKYIKDYRLSIRVGTGVATFATGLLILFDVDTSLGMQLGFVLILGLGQGLIFQNCTLTCQECAAEEYMAVATALAGFINSIGSAVGVAICSATINNALLIRLRKYPEEIQVVLRETGAINNMEAVVDLPDDIRQLVIHEYASSFQFLFKILTPMIGLGFLLSLFLRRRASLAQKA
ncbi:major facilitator superfamily domain-containing protein [Lobosporangium transversale]|uniref:Major facilitator superfamily domain-containing protein n=1 Tax=Lobosporangium transversale TaxID=64571 RepID=A0A1Y2G7S3_9FUNG|nr:major facilitator superfamily domain-containing protein [Lobosporangium transversale]ORZ01812.1 major facilitator superfamily domain-containing protein [Lobosporangium transversale]|eukprot:XP_021876109.1 major facilitator superfamily domain-containing protein [Lobosporangium transversale]